MLWESIQRARKTYSCDICGDWIHRGEVYMRTVMRTDDHLEVFRAHSKPSCPTREPDVEEPAAEATYLKAA